MKFKIGNRVLVKPHPSGDNHKYQETDEVFDANFYWTPKMDEYVGKVFTITEEEEGCYGFGNPDDLDVVFPPSSLTLLDQNVMKTFKFNHNDYVSVTLTKEGAEHISALRKEFYDRFPQLDRRKEFYVEGEILRCQFWALFDDFGDMMHLGMASPFYMGEIEVESSLEG